MRASETDEEVGGGRMMRVRVQVDISKPLCRGRKLGLANGEEKWVSFRYERLPNFCYWCGLLTHGEKDCEVWLENQETLSREARGYGPWLRADIEGPFRKMEVTVKDELGHHRHQLGPRQNPRSQLRRPQRQRLLNGMMTVEIWNARILRNFQIRGSYFRHLNI